MNFNMATYVEDPFSYGSKLAVLFTHPLILNSSSHSALFVMSVISILSSYWLSLMLVPFHIYANVILFMVKVPVLSEQMLLAPPMV